MKRVSECKAAVYLVAIKHGKVMGVVRGVYDGSRALIHQISVHPKHQKHGVGSALVREIANRFKAMVCANGFGDCKHEERGLFRKSRIQSASSSRFYASILHR